LPGRAGGRLITVTPVPVIIDGRTLESLAAGGARALDRFLLAETRALETEYKQHGIPRITALAAESLVQATAPLPQSKKSFQTARLHALVADKLIAHGATASDIRVAITSLEIALSILERIQTFSLEMLRAHVSFALLLGVARKAIGEFDEALRFMRETALDLRTSGDARYVDLVSLTRQETIMLQSPRAHRLLASAAISYRDTHPLEYYGSVKRVFEFVLNSGRLGEAQRLYPEWKASYLRVARRLDPLSRISFVKNLGQYAIERREVARASRLLGFAAVEAQRRGLLGQVRQIHHLIAKARDGGSAGKLLTYRIDVVG
jgi:hypothetical protein